MIDTKAIYAHWKIFILLIINLCLLSSCLQLDGDISWSGGAPQWTLEYRYSRVLAEVEQADDQNPSFYLPTSEQQWNELVREFGLSGSFQRREEGEYYYAILRLNSPAQGSINRWLPVEYLIESNRLELVFDEELSQIDRSLLNDEVWSITIRPPGTVLNYQGLDFRDGILIWDFSLRNMLSQPENYGILLEWSNG